MVYMLKHFTLNRLFKNGSTVVAERIMLDCFKLLHAKSALLIKMICLPILSYLPFG